MAVQADILYQKQREATLSYEDARFNSLMSELPNCYAPLNDSTIWGCFLRALAQELARIEYMYSYDLVALDTRYLTPPDIKRRYAAPLFINRSYPEPSQFDLDYRDMLVNLIAAYNKGATMEAIENVVTAYTGQNVAVLELYRQIGDGTYEDTDRNTLKVTLNATGYNPLSEVIAADALAIVAENLYTAIDYAKPAHVGIDYSISFGSGETLTPLLKRLSDRLTILYFGVETVLMPTEFTLAPYNDPESPDTRLAPIEEDDQTAPLSPDLTRSWGIVSDTLRIYRLD